MAQIKQTLPKGWRWAKLTELIGSLETGSRPKGGAQGITSGVPSLSAEHITNLGTFDFTNIRYVPREFYDQMSRGHIKQNDILIVKDGATTGKTIFIDEHFPLMEAVVNEHIFLCRPNQEIVSPLYLFYFLWSPVGQTQIRLNFQGAAIGGINQSFTENVILPLPPLDEQKRIAAHLGEQMHHIEQARQAAEESLSAAWDLSSAYLNDIFNSQKAKNWSKTKLGEVCEVTARQVDPKIPEYGALPHINGENIESGTGKLLHLNTAAEDGMTSGKYLFEAGDVLYSKLRPYLRKVFLPDFRGVCSADMYPIKVNREKLQSQFLVWLLISDGFTKYADEESRRARMPKLNREQLFAFEAPLPSLEEQEQISKLLDQKVPECNQLQQALKSQLAEINKLPSALLRQAFAGEL